MMGNMGLGPVWVYAYAIICISNQLFPASGGRLLNPASLVATLHNLSTVSSMRIFSSVLPVSVIRIGDDTASVSSPCGAINQGIRVIRSSEVVVMLVKHHAMSYDVGISRQSSKVVGERNLDGSIRVLRHVTEITWVSVSWRVEWCPMVGIKGIPMSFKGEAGVTEVSISMHMKGMHEVAVICGQPTYVYLDFDLLTGLLSEVYCSHNVGCIHSPKITMGIQGILCFSAHNHKGSEYNTESTHDFLHCVNQ